MIAEDVEASPIYNVSERTETGNDLKRSPGTVRETTVSVCQVKAMFNREPNGSTSGTARRTQKSRLGLSQTLKKAGGSSCPVLSDLY